MKGKVTACGIYWPLVPPSLSALAGFLIVRQMVVALLNYDWTLSVKN
jgi:hypothetical protein